MATHSHDNPAHLSDSIFPIDTTERALESSIEKSLTGTCREDLLAQNIESFTDFIPGDGSYWLGISSDFDAHYAIDRRRFWHFLESTQPKELEKLSKSPNWEKLILDRYDKLVKSYGILQLLRKGLDVDNAHFTLFYPLPTEVSAARAKDNYRKNEFSVMRQVPYNEEHTGEAIDMGIFVNGIPIITIELKNPWTGQTARRDAIRQYCNDRDANQPLLNFGRCIVHMALDTEEVYMCTRMAGPKSFFLPFNKGNGHGGGNPVNPEGHRTAYLWEEILQKDSLANILEHYVRFDNKPGSKIGAGTNLFFPRYHQLDVVRKLLSDIKRHGTGGRYLVQHSAGSGKSNSITWLAYQLIELYKEGSDGREEKMFDTVIVVTDRRQLDRQIRDNILKFSQISNIVVHADHSNDLREALESGKKIVITTIQKFPFICDKTAELSDHSFAVIIDEAHSSQTGIAAGKMNQAIGGIAPEILEAIRKQQEKGDDEEIDAEDMVNLLIESRKMQKNATYVAFTATPKNSTLERFGTKLEDGSFRPFHLYSMKQAIEEGFILDVLRNYTTYKSYYKLRKSIEDNPLLQKERAQKQLRAYVEKNRRTIRLKSEIIVEHFVNFIFNKKKLKGCAKGMVVTQSIESAIKYYLAINEILREKDTPFKVLIAFTGTKMLDGIEYTEEGINGFPSKDIAARFEEDEYRLLIVANKFLTGYDQPKLCTMYIDKRLRGVQAVQALSRLNRSADSLGKKTEDLYILDFFNEVDDIKEAFDPFYTGTSLSEETDCNVLHDIKSELDDRGVYHRKEVESFMTTLVKARDASELSPILDRVADRFNSELELLREEKADFKIKVKQFLKIYSQVSALLEYNMPEWERLYWFLKYLNPKLIVPSDHETVDEILDKAELTNIGIEITKESVRIGLDDSDAEVDPQNARVRGVSNQADEKEELEEIIRTFNMRFFDGWEATEEEKRVKIYSILMEMKDNPQVRQFVVGAPDYQNGYIALKRILGEHVNKNRARDLSFYVKFAQDETFRDELARFIANHLMKNNGNQHGNRQA